MLSIFIKPFSTRSQAHSTQTICSRRVDRPFNGTQRFSRAVPTGHCTCDTWPEPIADVMTSAVGPGSIFSYRRSVYTALTYLCVQSAVAKSRVPVTLKACGIRCTAVTEAGPAASTLQLPPGDQSIRDVQDMPSTSCAICMAEHLQNPARIQVCGHCFW